MQLAATKDPTQDELTNLFGDDGVFGGNFEVSTGGATLNVDEMADARGEGRAEVKLPKTTPKAAAKTKAMAVEPKTGQEKLQNLMNGTLRQAAN